MSNRFRVTIWETRETSYLIDAASESEAVATARAENIAPIYNSSRTAYEVYDQVVKVDGVKYEEDA